MKFWNMLTKYLFIFAIQQLGSVIFKLYSQTGTSSCSCRVGVVREAILTMYSPTYIHRLFPSNKM